MSLCLKIFSKHNFSQAKMVIVEQPRFKVFKNQNDGEKGAHWTIFDDGTGVYHAGLVHTDGDEIELPLDEIWLRPVKGGFKLTKRRGYYNKYSIDYEKEYLSDTFTDKEGLLYVFIP